MKKCWDVDPKERPNFSMLTEWFGNMMQESERQVCLNSVLFPGPGFKVSLVIF